MSPSLWVSLALSACLVLRFIIDAQVSDTGKPYCGLKTRLEATLSIIAVRST
jgi:hypothetical protein